MTRASAHNNGLFTLQSYPIPKPGPGIPVPLSTDRDGSALPQFESAGVQYRTPRDLRDTGFESREYRTDLKEILNVELIDFVQHFLTGLQS